ncbi:MAG: DNA damage-inducible protein D [Bacilli bacterium]|nr:DNA damage-inducible protein D [Bacilli bacterium]
MENIEQYAETIFEQIKHTDEIGNEYWYARELQKVLEYKEWRKFKMVIKKSMFSCNYSNNDHLEHFVQLDKELKVGNNARMMILDYKLSRYACYLIAQNGDSRKKVIALAQTYFAIQTRKQEILENLSEDEKRIEIRKRVRKGNLGLNQTAIRCGVKDMARFTNAGYKGLYNGETADDIAKRKDLRYREDILDHMESTELANNLFRIVQTDDKLKRDKVDNEYKACDTHFEIGRKVRKAIKDMGGTMPEELPTPKSSINDLKMSNKDKKSVLK